MNTTAYLDEMHKIAASLDKLRAAAAGIANPKRRAMLEARVALKEFGRSPTGKNLGRFQREAWKNADLDSVRQGQELSNQLVAPLKARSMMTEAGAKNIYRAPRVPEKLRQLRLRTGHGRDYMAGTGGELGQAPFVQNTPASSRLGPNHDLSKTRDKTEFQVTAQKRRIAKLYAERALRKIDKTK